MAKKKLRIVVLGTGELAIPSVERLVADGHEISRVVVRPRRAEDDDALPEEHAGSLLASWAEEQGLEVRRPTTPGSDEFREKIAALEPDLGVIVSYGRTFPTTLLDIPPLGWLKAHFSLLPKYRGHHAIRSSIASGESTLGVTLIQVTEDADSGPIVSQGELPSDDAQVFGTVAPQLAGIAADLLAAAVDKLAAGKKLKTRKQTVRRGQVTATRFTERHMRPPWWLGAKAVTNRLRALSPEPGMTCLIERQRVWIIAGKQMEWVMTPMGDVSSYLGMRVGRLAVLCDDNTVFGIERVRLEDGEELTASDFARRFELRVGTRII